MKVLWLVVGIVALLVVMGGVMGVAEDTYPNAVPISAPANHIPVTEEGNPALLIICVVGGLLLFLLGANGH